MFLLGLGIGAGLSAWITMLFVMIAAGKIRRGSFKEQEQFNKETLEMMRTRNILDAEKIKALEAIAIRLGK